MGAKLTLLSVGLADSLSFLIMVNKATEAEEITIVIISRIGIITLKCRLTELPNILTNLTQMILTHLINFLFVPLPHRYRRKA